MLAEQSLCEKFAVPHEPDGTGWCPVCETQVKVADGSEHITLDRTNLLRLCDVLAAALRPELLDALPEGERLAFEAGHRTAIEGLRMIAQEMPHLYGDQGYPADAVTEQP